jgi:hypothetical protein
VTARRTACVISLVSLLAAGCGGSNDSSGAAVATAPAAHKLRPSEVRPAFRGLPYRYSLKRVARPKGNRASFLGRAHGPYGTTLEFSIGIGDPPYVVPVPGAGTLHAVWDEPSGFVFNDDSSIASKFKSPAQWREVSRMATDFEERLCLAATGEPCPI